jgi:heme/copper-type cytochrome/quinol oxidase subunit 2
VAHYLEDKTETVLPGQVVNLSFLADETGTFLIYCSTFNPIHIYLQGGELNVV